VPGHFPLGVYGTHCRRMGPTSAGPSSVKIKEKCPELTIAEVESRAQGAFQEYKNAGCVAPLLLRVTVWDLCTLSGQ
jgi:hypothetical protein